MNMNMNMQFNDIKFQYKNLESLFDNIERQIMNMNYQNLSTNIIDLGVNIINNGIQMLFMGIQIPDITRNNFSILNKINDSLTKIQNISMAITNINYQMPMMNMGELHFNNNIINNNNSYKPVLNIVFNYGEKINIIANFGTTIDEILRKFMVRINFPGLINDNDAFFFLYNNKHLNFGDNRKIEDFLNIPTDQPIDMIIDVIPKKQIEAGE